MRAVGPHDPGSRNIATHLAAENDLLAIWRIESADALPEISGEDFSLSAAVRSYSGNGCGAESGQRAEYDAFSIRRPTRPDRAVVVSNLMETRSVDVDDEKIRPLTRVVTEGNALTIR